MKYALLNNNKIEATKDIVEAKCPCCLEYVIPKCGSINIHHWAHKTKINCDDWWEPETEWHRQWKSLFSIDNQEVVCTDIDTNEKHVADVRLNNGLVIEFQNSPISIDDLQSREMFYKKMIWVVNANAFRQNITVFNDDYGLQMFRWEQIRKVWLSATMPVFLDFPNNAISWSLKKGYKEIDFSDKILWVKGFFPYKNNCKSNCWIENKLRRKFIRENVLSNLDYDHELLGKLFRQNMVKELDTSVCKNFEREYKCIGGKSKNCRGQIICKNKFISKYTEQNNDEQAA
jgi:competence CoiA-like predicted nuclease